MGLAPYGEGAYEDLMRDLAGLPDDGWFRLKRGALYGFRLSPE